MPSDLPMETARKIPATVITGFLGAGKTTLIRHLIRNAGGRRIALIVNEFGDVGIDGELLRGCGDAACSGEDDIVELANGCICCTVAEDFIPTMEALLNRDLPPEHIIIETSGLALPQPLVRAFNWPEIKTRVTVDGVVTLVDAAALAEGRFAADEDAVEARRRADVALDHETPLGELFVDQLSAADLIILNKADLITEEQAARLASRLLQEARDGVKVMRARHGEVPLDVLTGLEAEAEEDDRRTLHERHHHHHDHDHDDHGDNHHHHDHDHDAFESFAVTFDEIPTPEALTERLQAVIATHDIFRVKGFVAVRGRDMRLVVQAVGPRIDSYFDRDWQTDEERRSRLVIIGQAGLDRTRISEELITMRESV